MSFLVTFRVKKTQKLSNRHYRCTPLKSLRFALLICRVTLFPVNSSLEGKLMAESEKVQLESGMTVLWMFKPDGGFGRLMFIEMEVVGADGISTVIDFWGGDGTRIRRKVRTSQLLAPCEECFAEIFYANAMAITETRHTLCDCSSKRSVKPKNTIST